VKWDKAGGGGGGGNGVSFFLFFSSKLAFNKIIPSSGCFLSLGCGEVLDFVSLMRFETPV